MNESSKAAPLVEISVILPIYNEEENIGPLLEEIERALGPLGRAFEVLCIDDRSTDGSLAVMQELRRTRPFVRIIGHRVNCGESAGHATGFRFARGEIVITMDSDGQNDPADIPMLLGELRDDIAAVCGVRRIRRDSLVRRLSSRIANAYRNWFTGDRIRDAGCALRVLRRSALAEIPVFNGLHRFLPTILRCQGYKVIEVEVNHRPRLRGKSKYGIGNRLWRGIRDCFAMRWFRARALPGDRVEREYT